jgi:hypothetical protein
MICFIKQTKIQIKKNEAITLSVSKGCHDEVPEACVMALLFAKHMEIAIALILRVPQDDNLLPNPKPQTH